MSRAAGDLRGNRALRGLRFDAHARDEQPHRDSRTPPARARVKAACTWSTCARPPSPRAAGCFSLDGYTHETQCVIYDGPDTCIATAKSASTPTKTR